jgi:UDP-N-acetyl-D-galactosamine dehydrogenase
MNLDDRTIAIIGLGYVGLPLAAEFGRLRPVVGFDVDAGRIAALRAGSDHTHECSPEDLAAAGHLRFSCDPADLRPAGVFIVTVPTPVDQANRPDLTLLIEASRTVAGALKRGDVVIYESTVYPGATEEVCVPVLEAESGLEFNVDFFCGYSPERINPGDRLRRLAGIMKITSGSTPDAAEAVDRLYRQIITAGTHRAPSLKVAEAAKVIENTQRDLNIALMNELSLICHRIGIDTLDVLEAAGTKWNFLPFRPGLVGGHCICVDPYYLTHKAQEVGYEPEVILAGRRVNDAIVAHVADQTVKLMLRKGMPVLGSRVLVLGLTFKENCPDIRNTKVVDLVRMLEGYRLEVDVYDPWVDVEAAREQYGLACLGHPPENGRYDAIVLAVGHRQFIDLGAAALRALAKPEAVIFDVKGLLPKGMADARL